MNRYWTRDLDSLSDYEVSKKVIHLLRLSQHVYREEDGAVHFWSEWKSPESIPTIYSLVWRSMESMFGSRRWVKTRFSTFEGHSGRNLIDPSVQDNFFVPSNFFQHIYHCWRSEFEQSTDSILLACWSYGQKTRRSLGTWLECITSCTIPVQLHGRDVKTQKNLVDTNLAIEKGLTFYRIRWNAIIVYSESY